MGTAGAAAALRQVITATLATVVWFLCVPLLFYLWLVLVVQSSNVAIAQGWTEADWRKPFGYYGVMALEIILAAVLLWVDTFL